MKFVVWDWNGTLFDDVSVCIECLNTLLKRHDLPVVDNLETYKKVFRFPVIEYYKNVGFDFEKNPFDQLAFEYMEIYYERSQCCGLSESARETIERLGDKKIKQLILSASNRDDLLHQMGRFKIEHWFDEILGLDNVFAHSKAALAQNLRARKAYAPEEMLFVGDTVHDSEIAKLLGCKCLLYSKGHQELPKNSLDFTVIDRLSEVLDYV